MERYLFLIAGWAAYFFIHSLLASEKVKEKANTLLGRNFFYYRLAYSFISILGLFVLLFFNASIPSENIINSQGPVRYVSLVCAGLGVIVIRLAFKEYDLGGFIGIKNERDEFKVSGILQKVRHPIYSGTILIVIGFWLFTPNWPTLISVACIFTYLAIGIWLEERKLIRRFGEPYLRYKDEVPMLIPKFW